MFNHFLLLAERNPFRDMASVVRDRREHFDPLDLLPWLLVLAALFGVLAVVSRYLNRQDKRRLFNHPRALFRDLCRAHGLDGAECRLLHQLAKANGIDQPAALFLDFELLQAASTSAEFRRHQSSIEALIAKLFANELPLTKAPPAAPLAQPKPRPSVTQAITSQPAQDAEAAPPPEKPASSQRPQAKQPATTGEDSREEVPAVAGPSVSEQHAVRALEALMKQIHASRETPSPSTSPSENARTSPSENSSTRSRTTGNQPRPLVLPDVPVPMNNPVAHQ